MTYNCNDNYGCGGACDPGSSNTAIKQAVNDALAAEKETLQGYVTNAANSATESEESAADAAASASAAAQSQTNAETAANTAVTAAQSVTDTAEVLEETASAISKAQELINEQVASIQTKPVYFSVTEPTATLVLPETDTVYSVRSIYVSSLRQDLGFGFTFDRDTRTVTLLDPITQEDFDEIYPHTTILITVICDVFNSDDPTSLPLLLASNAGAGMIGTTAGITVEAALSNLNKISSTDSGEGDQMVGLVSLNDDAAITTQYEENISYLNILRFGKRSAFSAALMAAVTFANANKIGKIYVPGGDYTVEDTAIITLTRDLQIEFDPGAVLICNSPINILSVTGGAYLLDLRSMRAYANWTDTSNSAAVLTFTGRTLRHNLRVYDILIEKSGIAGSNFMYGIKTTGANSAQIERPNISAADYPIWFSSSTENTSSAFVANSMEPEVSSPKLYNAIDGITVENKGYYGCEGLILRDGKIVCTQYPLNIKADATLRGSYMPPLVQIQNMHLNGYWAARLEKVSRIYVVNVDVQSKYNPTDSVLGMFEFYSCQGITLEAVTFTSVGYQSAVKADINSAVYFGELDSSLPNAYVSIDSSKFWLDGMTAKVFDMSSTSALTGRIIYGGANIKQTLSALISSAYKIKMSIPSSIFLDSYDIAEGLAYQSSTEQFSFNSSTGVLTIGSRAAARDLFLIPTSVLPAGSVVNQIVANNMYGRQLVLQIQSAEVTFVHGTNLILPSFKNVKCWLPTFMVIEMFNNQQGRVVSLAGDAARRPMLSAAPTAATAGSVGDWYLSGNTLTEWLPGAGWYTTTVTKLV